MTIDVKRSFNNNPDCIQYGYNEEVVDIPCAPEFKKIQPIVYHDLTHIGQNADGGYVVPDTAGIYNLLTLGLDANITFEKDWKKTYPNSKIYGYCNAGKKYSQEERDLFHDLDNNIHVDESNFDSLVSKMNGKFFFKMDIEGGEYNIYKTLLSNESCVGGVLELHACCNEGARTEEAIAFLDYVEQSDYEIVNFHFNNLALDPLESLERGLYPVWRALEVTLLRKQFCPADRQLATNSLNEHQHRNVPWHPEVNCVF